MGIPATIPAGEYVPTADQRVVMYGVPWAHYETLLALRGEASSPRIAYLEGALELMTPSKDHERNKSFIGRLLEAWAIERGVPPTSRGAVDLVIEGELRGSASMVYHVMDEGDVERIMKHPMTMIASDGSLNRPGEGVSFFIKLPMIQEAQKMFRGVRINGEENHEKNLNR